MATNYLVISDSTDFEVFASKISPQYLDLKSTDLINKISFLDLKIKQDKKDWLIGLFDKRLDFNFKINSLTNWC